MGDSVTEDKGVEALAAQVAGLEYADLSLFLASLSTHLLHHKRVVEKDSNFRALTVCLTRVYYKLEESAKYADEASKYCDEAYLPCDPWVAFMVECRTLDH